MRRIWLIGIGVLLLAGVVSADIVVLKDGTRIEGNVVKSPGGWRITTADGKTIEVATDQVKSIEVGGGGGKATPDRAMSDLLSLRRAVENINDLHQIIDRFKHFIDQNKDTPAATEAKKDLATWQDRLDRGLVKLGSRWIPPEERTAYADKAIALAEEARGLVIDGRNHDADILIAQALDSDPQCAPALYLRGVIQYQQNQIPAARKSFEAVIVLLVDHAPSLNNLAVILSRQNALMPSLAQYEKSITASPVNKYLLDNVAEALAKVPDDQRKNKVAQSLFRKFTEQDTRLQEAMAAQGLYRWGSTWVDKAEMERMRDIEKQVKEKMVGAKAEADTAEQRVRSIDAEIQQIDRSLRQIESDSVYRDADGRLVRLPYPAAYYDLQNQQAKLRSERAKTIVTYTAAQSKLKQLQAELPQPKFKGVQQIVGAEGAPQMIPPPTPTEPSNAAPAAIEPPATGPATAPTTAPTTQP